MGQTIIAVLGTLAAVVITSAFQSRAARTARDAARSEDHRREAIAAVTALAASISAHRVAMVKVGEARLTGADAARVQDLRDAAHATRTAITEPAARVQLIAPAAVRDAAHTAIHATFAMRHPANAESLNDAREHALRTHDALIDAASQTLA
ncbi:pRL2-23 [Streptomyces anulatus]|uniref:pRL2-23 n=1 Tax=Streptomyces anulatus TaxID=1892 RepID=UPI0035E18285